MIFQKPLTSIARRSSRRWLIPANDYLKCYFLAVSLVCGFPTVSIAQETAGEYPRRIEVFTTSEFPLTGDDTITQRLPGGGIELHVFTLDGLQRIEAGLSEGLPSDPALAKRTALKRIQQLDGTALTSMHNAAMGLTTALEYGIDRYPAILFDGRIVVYGLTDLRQALQHYRAWRTGVGS